MTLFSAPSINSSSQLFLVFTLASYCPVFTQAHPNHGYNWAWLDQRQNQEQDREEPGHLGKTRILKMFLKFWVFHFQWIGLYLCVDNTLNLPEALFPYWQMKGLNNLSSSVLLNNNMLSSYES